MVCLTVSLLVTHLLKRASRNEWEKSKIFRKISLKFIFCQNDCQKSYFVRPNSKPYFFSAWVFFHDHSRITGLQGKGRGISLTPHYTFHLLHRHLDISQVRNFIRIKIVIFNNNFAWRFSNSDYLMSNSRTSKTRFFRH